MLHPLTFIKLAGDSTRVALGVVKIWLLVGCTMVFLLFVDDCTTVLASLFLPAVEVGACASSV